MSLETPSVGTSDRCNGTCQACAASLQGRQRRFCSDACRMAWWDANHPRINRGTEGPRAITIKALILGLLADGNWRTDQQIADSIHAFAHTVSARISELVRAGHPIESEKLARGLRRRRLSLPQPDQALASTGKPPDSQT